MKIYVASSWRNTYHPAVIWFLRESGHEVYDYRNPTVEGPSGADLENGFQWGEIDPQWEAWTPREYAQALNHELAKSGFGADMRALQWAHACLLLQPGGRSAHLELGYACGNGKIAAAYVPPSLSFEPELMLKMAGAVLVGPGELIEWSESLARLDLQQQLAEEDR